MREREGRRGDEKKKKRRGGMEMLRSGKRENDNGEGVRLGGRLALRGWTRPSAGVRELEAPKYKCEAPIIEGLRVPPPVGSRSRSQSGGAKPP